MNRLREEQKATTVIDLHILCLVKTEYKSRIEQLAVNMCDLLPTPDSAGGSHHDLYTGSPRPFPTEPCALGREVDVMGWGDGTQQGRCECGGTDGAPQVLQAVDGGPFRWLCPAFRGTQVFFSQRPQVGSRRCQALLDSNSPGFSN